MDKPHSKFTSSPERAAGIEAALLKIKASGLKERFMRQDRTGAYEAEREMEHGNFARSTRFSVDRGRQFPVALAMAPLRKKFIDRLGLRMVWTFCGANFRRPDCPPRYPQVVKIKK
ncbi:hypothetical protein [Pseudomonas oryzihabitans]|uniref:hypothetical protein n=1 Tax=Pseudomonas oryzihabitans TaxID=47885 RepID=UPI0011A18472|nr:hypothetical protein [Pseudomonas oryzihabitans]